ncbi:hypothetical protein OIDMADRAFT_32787 [Oidiodendron maius Zn]|uniref:Uncharacterized protein n=1 Tax=Oidiodendron maius (strain Zn) TaxID=913774 RepID=A0A0C3H2X1_OIDMZ|nr:hypothetical protein OIDMADRAFT_32787 [Oidiodendron maius Zn]
MYFTRIKITVAPHDALGLASGEANEQEISKILPYGWRKIGLLHRKALCEPTWKGSASAKRHCSVVQYKGEILQYSRTAMTVVQYKGEILHYSRTAMDERRRLIPEKSKRPQ